VSVQKGQWEAQMEVEGSVANLYHKKYPKKE